jgi:hypothetical protein
LSQDLSVKSKPVLLSSGVEEDLPPSTDKTRKQSLNFYFEDAVLKPRSRIYMIAKYTAGGSVTDLSNQANACTSEV